MHNLLNEGGAFVDKIYACTSADPLNPRRKPNPGLLIDAFQDFKVNPDEAIFIGDALRDLEAARAINCSRILVRTGKGQKTLEEGIPETLQPILVFNTLFEAVSHILDEDLC